MTTPEDLIPEGMYCYTPKRITLEPKFVYEVEPCPHYSRVNGLATCGYLNKNEDEEFLLSDQVKCCGVNESDMASEQAYEDKGQK